MGVPPNHSKLEHFSIETNGDWGSSIFRNPPNIGDVTPRLTFGSAFMRLCVLIILYIHWIFNGLLPTYNWEISSVLVSHFLCSAEAADASGTRFPRHGLHGFSYGTPTVKVEPYSTQMVVPELQKFKRIPSLVQCSAAEWVEVWLRGGTWTVFYCFTGCLACSRHSFQ